MEAEIYDEIGRYVAGEMEGEELHAFEARLKNEATLQEKVALFRFATTSLDARFSREAQMAKLKETLSAMGDAHITEQSAGSGKTKWYWMAAASITLCAAILYGMLSSKPDYSDYAVFEPLALTERGAANPLKTQAEQTFNNHEYVKALTFINAVLQLEPDNTELKLYKGIALIELNQYVEATALLETIRKESPVYSDRALWLQALGELKQQHYDACRSLLKEIKPGADDYSKAQDLLDDL